MWKIPPFLSDQNTLFLEETKDSGLFLPTCTTKIHRASLLKQIEIVWHEQLSDNI